MSVVLQGLPGLQPGLSVGCIDLISTDSPSWLHTWRLKAGPGGHRVREGQVRLGVQARALGLRGREVGWHHPGLGTSPLGAFAGCSGSLLAVRTPVRDPLFLSSDS